jgi:hypothetical protein
MDINPVNPVKESFFPRLTEKNKKLGQDSQDLQDLNFSFPEY